MRVVVAGSTGLIGTALVTRLRADGHTVVPLVRRPPAQGEVHWDPAGDELETEAIEGADAVVNLAGAGIGDHRWTPEYRQEIHDSRTLTTGLLARTITTCSRPPAVFLSGSAVGIYGDRGDEMLDERSSPGNDFLAGVCKEWEAAAEPATSAGTRVVTLRTGIVLTPRGGALRKQLPLFKLGIGGKFGSGRQWQSWISLADEVGAIVHLLTAPVHGAVGLNAPSPVTNADFARTLGRVLRRAAIVPIPAAGPRLFLGRELADSLLFSSQRVHPTALLESGYEFQHDTLEVALRSMLGR